MERHFQSTPFAGEVFSPVFNNDDSSIESLYSGMSFQALLGVNQEKSLFPSLDYTYGASPLSFGSVPNNFNSTECLKLKMPKDEPMIHEELMDNTNPFNFISSDPISSVCDSMFHQLPDLRCLEHAESSLKRLKSFPPPANDSHMFDSIFRSFQISPAVRSPSVAPSSVLARHRRQKISDKTRCLQKLLPWDKKMDMATMLEEAYKYIKFLQAQISVLQSMPCQSSGFSTQNPSNVDGNVFGDLGNLNRQQLLQVVVNSPAAQTILYSQGCCVYSIEQLVFLKKIAEKKVLYQQMALDPSMLTI